MVLADDLKREFLYSAVGGVSKTQTVRTYMEEYGLTDYEIEELIASNAFKDAPAKIDYKALARCAVARNGRRIFYPFTQVYIKENFIDLELCEQFRERIDKNLRPSTVSDDKDTCKVSDYRTSKTADLHYFDDALYLSLDQKLAFFMGLDHFLGECMQAQKYEPGQYFKEHWDYFDPDTKEYDVYCEWMGQRSWTTMLYLNDVEEGGETYFKHLNLKIKPKAGLLLAWNNLHPDGRPNIKTMHEALPPLSGEKYIITKWWRSWTLI
jgi:prolyl 4-hydroxylase